MGLGAERSPSLEGLPVRYSVELGGGASDSDRWRDPSCAGRITVAQHCVHGWVGLGGGRAYPGAANAHVTRARGRNTVARVRWGAGPAPTGGGAATDTPARIGLGTEPKPASGRARARKN